MPRKLGIKIRRAIKLTNHLRNTRLLLILTLLGCTSLAQASADRPWVTASTIARYRDFEFYFNTTFASRFPFGDLDSPDANLSALRDFVHYHAPQLPALRDAVLESEPGRWTADAGNFLNQLIAIADFLEIALEPSTALHLRVHFNPPSTEARGVDQLVTWRFSSGDAGLTHPHLSPATDRTLRWSPGQPVSLDFIWADRSPHRPQSNQRLPQLEVDGREANLTYNGDWALLRLLRGQPEGVLVSLGEAPGFRQILISIPTVDSSASSPAPGTAHLQAPLELETFVIDPRTSTERQLEIPMNWPRRSPPYATAPLSGTESVARDLPRVLQIAAPSAEDPLYREQAAWLVPAWEELLTRDMFVETHFGAPAFSVVLIGKDGGEKLRRAVPLAPKELFAIIDAMPMRQAELRDQRASEP